jgi:predicted component of type VI protein secretion system
MRDERKEEGGNGSGDVAAKPRVWFHTLDGHQRTMHLTGTRHAVGRDPDGYIVIDWDPEVSRVHAELERIGEIWTIVDDGLSRNGTFVNGERISGRRRLQDGDSIRVGETTLTYQHTSRSSAPATAIAQEQPLRSSFSETQRGILVALCRPYKRNSAYATPATNQQIADELYLSIDAVKTHLRTLFRKFNVEDLPQNQKRARLVELAFHNGIVTQREL